MEFAERITQYGKLDSQMKSLKTTLDKEKDEIKSYMMENAIDSYSSDEYKVQCVKSTKTAMNEVNAMNLLKEFWKKEHDTEECPFVKTVEVLNHEALESALYHEELPGEMIQKLNACIIMTDTYALKCSKIKNRKEQ